MINMTIKEFTNLTFHEASEVIRKAHPGRVSGRESYLDLCTAFGLSDTSWSSELDKELTKEGPENTSMIVQDKWAITKIRYVIKIKYSDEISINYHIGNTATGSTLKEISFQGIGTYWSSEYPELEKNLGLSKNISVRIPLVPYRNGRKGTVSDMLNKHYGLLKLRVDVAIQEMDDCIKSGKFEELWNEAIDQVGGNKVPNSYFYKKNNLKDLDGYLGNHYVSLASDPAGVSPREIICYLKTLMGVYEGDYKTDLIYRYFGSSGPYFRSCDVKSAANMIGLRNSEVDCIRVLSQKIQKHLELDGELEQLRGALDVMYEDALKKESLVTGLSVEKLKELMSVSYNKHINYSDLQ